MADTKLFLWNHPVSSYAVKVRIALREKKIPFDFDMPENIGSGKPSPGLSSANPRVEVPALVDGDFKIFDSKVIVQYLEDKYPESPLIAPVPRLKAEAAMIQEVCDGPYEAANWVWMEVNVLGRTSGELAEKINAATKQQIKKMQAWLVERLGNKPWFNGDSFGLADIFAFAVVNRSYYYGLGPEEGRVLFEWLMRMKERPAVHQTSSEMVESYEAFKEMARTENNPFKPGKGSRREYRDYRLEMMMKVGGTQVVLDGLRDDTIRFSWPPI